MSARPYRRGLQGRLSGEDGIEYAMSGLVEVDIISMDEATNCLQGTAFIEIWRSWKKQRKQRKVMTLHESWGNQATGSEGPAAGVDAAATAIQSGLADILTRLLERE